LYINYLSFDIQDSHSERATKFAKPIETVKPSENISALIG